jgi:ribosomal protein S18 acetylase RimI-like enzyme
VPEIVPFADDHLDGAAELLAERHRRHRAVEPLLPARFEDPGEARGEIEAALAEDGASGVVALSDGRVVAYLVAAPRDGGWGPSVWVGLAGHAAEDAEVVRDLYAHAAAAWVAAGWTMHYVLAPATDGALVEAWFRLGFGQQHAYGIREVPVDARYGAWVREAGADDLDVVVELSPLLDDHQALSPVFSAGAPPQSEEEVRAEVAEELASAAFGTLVAETDGRMVGALLVCEVEQSPSHVGLARPEGAAFLTWAATRPEVRGSGAGRALTDGAFAWARERGHDVMVVDWRTTNLLASRFWPRRGFRPTFLRLHRAIVVP